MQHRDYIPETPCVCINLRRIAQKVTELYDNALKPVGITVNQYSLLVNISTIEGCGTGELARKVRLEKSTLVRTLQPLLREGFIIDRASGGRRRRCLYLSPAGEEVLKAAFPLWNRAQEEVAARLRGSHANLMEIFEEIDLWE
jgi:Transcriptional regulators